MTYSHEDPHRTVGERLRTDYISVLCDVHDVNSQEDPHRTVGERLITDYINVLCDDTYMTYIVMRTHTERWVNV